MKQQWRQRGLGLGVFSRRRVLNRRSPQFFIHGDRKEGYERVAQAMAFVQRSAMLKLGFMTQPGG